MRQWHLDCPYPESLFQSNWSSCGSMLLSLFAHLDKSKEIVTTTLPAGATPASIAGLAAMYFLPGLKEGTEPHCRIALFPGHHFIRHLREIKFSAPTLLACARVARLMGRGTYRIPSPIKHLQDISQIFADKVCLHWIWKCRRVWTRYNEIRTQEISPRNYFGRGDNTNAIIDLIESDSIDLIGKRYGPYDLLIYCPEYQPFGMSPEKINETLKNLEGFSAARKLALVRSPYGFWSRKLEEHTGAAGMSLTFSKMGQREGAKSPIKFNVVDQFLNIEEAVRLRNAISEAKHWNGVDPSVFAELKAALKFLVVDAFPTREPELLKENIALLREASAAVGLNSDPKIERIISDICERAAHPINTKKDFLTSEYNGREIEIWVTTNSDKSLFLELKNTLNLPMSVRLISRFGAVPEHVCGVSVILSRIDTERDLGLVPYLRPGDAVILSAWEAALAEEKVEDVWERSEAWREAAANSLSMRAEEFYDDAVLELADTIQKLTSSCATTDLPNGVENDSGPSWWDSTNLDHIPSRQSLIKPQVATVSCREIFLGEGTGIFLRADSEVQIVEDVEGDPEAGEFGKKDVANLAPGDAIVIFRDSERSSIFEILIDQLESRSSEYGEDAKLVRVWKEEVRSRYYKSGLSIADIEKCFCRSGDPVDQISIRSWILGDIMAPQKYERFLQLKQVLHVDALGEMNTFNAVKKLRVFARNLGRALNTFAKRDLSNVPKEVLGLFDEAGIDLEEIMGMVEIRTIMGVSPGQIRVPFASVGKLYSKTG